ncbi:hypothetical protein N5C18_19210 [Stenotrophomonas sp. GD03930]|uniref:hypothetical protein n=1 Tax=Stenotrophomonas TaxID=40323 RepID=UPI0008DCDB0F|nr:MULTISPECIES: hypothetical protein [Stenotrophomonas]MBN5162627.1 hypothetical protein [Stenotrophomonas maltophilia]MDH1233743.1 hypothetical protein [Stenotrophomonas sp. GD03930]OHY71382.1 hypothetical protein BB780_05815 [Stenotrophomonas maltophilia]HEL4843870.1 hypothetical protein [Stenotrophomonas maltophilia]
MKRFSLPLTLCLAAFMPLHVSAQAAPDEVHAAADHGKPKADKKRLFKAGGIGCVAGGAIALLTGKKDKALGACAAGAAVGASASYVNQQREHAEQAADAARAAGMKAEVVTKTETVEGKQEAVLDSLRLNYNPTDMKRLDSDTRAFLDKFAGLLNKSSNGLTVVFQGADKAACQVPIVELAKRGALSKVTVDDRCGSGEPVIVVTPVPDVR